MGLCFCMLFFISCSRSSFLLYFTKVSVCDDLEIKNKILPHRWFVKQCIRKFTRNDQNLTCTRLVVFLELSKLQKSTITQKRIIQHIICIYFLNLKDPRYTNTYKVQKILQLMFHQCNQYDRQLLGCWAAMLIILAEHTSANQANSFLNYFIVNDVKNSLQNIISILVKVIEIMNYSS